MKTKINLESGQTLIETIVAIFILTMALVSGLGLAIYAMTTTQETKERIIATNLAREGIEVIRMMRDSNWLAAQNTSTNSDDLRNCNYPTGTRSCYPRAFDHPNDMDAQNAPSYYIVAYTPNAAPSVQQFILDRAFSPSNVNYLMCLLPSGIYANNNGTTISCQGDSVFARQVQITTGNTNSPFTNDRNSPNSGNGHSPEKIVTSTVIWRGKGCTSYDSGVVPATFVTECKITVIEHLTNWKDYQ